LRRKYKKKKLANQEMAILVTWRLQVVDEPGGGGGG